MKFYYFTTILVGMAIILSLGGFNLPVTGGFLKQFNLIDDGGNVTVQDVKESDFWEGGDTLGGFLQTSLYFILVGAVVGGIVLGVLGRSPDPRYIKGGITFALAGAIIADYIAIYIKLAKYGGWIGMGAGAFFAVLIAGFFISIPEWWEGVD